MSLSKTGIITALNNHLRTSESTTTISSKAAQAIRAGLAFVSKQGRWPCLHTSATESLTTSSNSINKPSNYRELDYIILYDGSTYSKPLDRTTWEAILHQRAGVTSNSSEPRRYVERGSKFELDYTCDQSYTAYIYNWRYHPDQETILFGDEFERAVVFAVTAAYLEILQRYDEANTWYSKAVAECADLPEDVKTIKPNFGGL